MPRRARSGTAYNKAPLPPDSDDEGGGEHQVRFQADPASQSPSRMPRRARSGTAYNKAPPPPDSDDDEVDIWTGARKGVQFEDVQAALTHDLFGPGGQAEKKKKGWQRRRSGTAFNRAPPPPEEDDEGGGEHQVRFQADSASQPPSRMPRRARSGTAYNKAPMPPDSDDDEEDNAGGKGVQFEDAQSALTHDLFGPGGQAEKKKKGWQRRRAGTAYNRAPPPPEDNEEEYDDVSSSADSTESSDDEDGDQGNTDKGGSSIAAQPSNATQRTLPRVGSRLFNNAFA